MEELKDNRRGYRSQEMKERVIIMTLYDSKKKLALAGVICGIVAAILAFMGNPANMAF